MRAFPAGVIEGFYGRPWSWRDRHAQVAFLARAGLNSYIYAPKSDPFLRKRWTDCWPEDQFCELAALAASCRISGISWGVGFSPFELYRNYDRSGREKLRSKLDEINRLDPDILCVLFDDMRGDLPDIARLQAEIVHDIAASCVAQNVIMCPTYYSFDPLLEKVFGARPESYWDDLGSLLDAGIDFFWTGDKVCSRTYSLPSLALISEQMRRPPVLWDNYPVNDGARMSRRLHLQPFESRPHQPVDWLRGQLVNPMNQAWLSRLPLLTLADNEGVSEQRFVRASAQCCPGPLAKLLRRDLELFSSAGLDGITEGDKKVLLGDYSAYAHPCAVEVCQWLRGEYAFDPACLTD